MSDHQVQVGNIVECQNCGERVLIATCCLDCEVAAGSATPQETRMTEIIDRSHPERRETRCDRCEGPNPISWWVDSDRWHIACTAYGGTVEQPAENPFLCPTCFLTLWERMTGLTASWHLAIEPSTIRAQGSDEWFAEHAPEGDVRVDPTACGDLVDRSARTTRTASRPR